ncbi:hypothetical protein STRATTON_37 [Erwinia phage vB_EamM_Stratton]|uniref:Uncharacterized protein n=2 Tax=Erskinevirus EaH2 TaxID=2169883 RepID=A0A1B2IGU8_9CAUD|nr:hypothetical protein G173_gp204 [Erwinia phage phiEaH2]AFQ96749.1 hypothetical protein [Erwinia phage phiEaH2]ANZ50462.1 hypothetical protein STRATTON_37 [Erwinia phage vB_EamM_Stratton]
MVKVVDTNANNASQNANLNTETQAPLGGNASQPSAAAAAASSLGNVGLFDRAFGWQSTNSYASAYVAQLEELAKENSYLRGFKWGIVDGVGADMGSAAYIAGDYNGHWLYGILFFERGQSLRLKETTGGAESYYTITELLDTEFLKTVSKTIQATHQLPNAHFMAVNSVPDLGKQLSKEWAQQLTGQLALGIFGRIQGFLGQMQLSKSDRFTAQVFQLDDGSVLDGNGHAQRADFGVTLEHVPATSDNSTPTLMDNSQAQMYPRVHGVGYVNMRFTGQKPAVNGVPDLKQLQAEIVVSLMDSQAEGSRVPMERQILELAAFAEIASIGGWRDLFMKGLNGTDRKWSRVVEYLNWGTDQRPDISKIDKSREAIEGCLDMFAPREAALVVSHRAGNGIGGLSTILSEIAGNSDIALKQLLTILNGMTPRAKKSNDELIGTTGTKNFTQRFAAALGKDTITCADVVKAAVPTVSGVYTGNTQKRSFQDMDLVSVLTKFGDNQTDVYTYLHAQSYSHRELNARAQRIYMLKLAAVLFGAKDARITGESLDMAVNPVFAKCVLDFVRENCNWQLTGVSAHNSIANSLFFNNGGENFTLSGTGSSAQGSDFSLGVSIGSLDLGL